MLRTHTCGALRKAHAGEQVTLCGWVERHRVKGKISFLALRDRYGITQVFVNPSLTESLGEIRKESVVQVTGTVKERPEDKVNAEMATGAIEVTAEDVNILSASDELPLALEDTIASTEETRLQYRYLDLRREEMQRNMALRHAMLHSIRSYLHARDFIHIHTPLLTKSTPEGARDFLVPSRHHTGNFYALPQSPQQYKQLLMVAGFDRYFQIAPCLRDEDARADRTPGEFYQLDVEMSFVEQEDILQLMEGLMQHIVEQIFPDKYITQTPFPRLSYDYVMREYGTDKPDIRQNTDDENALGFCWIVDFPLFTEQSEDDYFYGAGQYLAPSHHMFTMPKQEDIPLLDTDPTQVRSTQMDLVLNGLEVGGGSMRIHDAEVQSKIFELIGFSEEQKAAFAHLLEAFRYGVPPHGGIAPGIERLLMGILGTDSVRDTVAFPKDKKARDLVIGAPSLVDPWQLAELGLSSHDQYCK